jgi:hypothetical protein
MWSDPVIFIRQHLAYWLTVLSQWVAEPWEYWEGPR